MTKFLIQTISEYYKRSIPALVLHFSLKSIPLQLMLGCHPVCQGKDHLETAPTEVHGTQQHTFPANHHTCYLQISWNNAITHIHALMQNCASSSDNLSLTSSFQVMKLQVAENSLQSCGLSIAFVEVQVVFSWRRHCRPFMQYGRTGRHVKLGLVR